MTDARTGPRRRATTAGAAAVLVVVGAVVASGAERAERADKLSPGVELAFQDTPRTFYFRTLDASEDPMSWGLSPEPYTVTLGASRRSPGREPAKAEHIKVTVDLSDAKSVAVSLDAVDRSEGCKWSGALVTCTAKDGESGKLKDIASGDYDSVAHFHMSPKDHAEKGPAGSLKITVASSNAPTIHQTTQLVIGAPRLTARDARDLWDPAPDRIEPGSELKLRPAFGNKGKVDVEGDLNVVVEAKGQATLHRQYSNCRYDRADAPKKAMCTIPGPLPVGAAYETDRPFTLAIAKTGSEGRITSTVYPAPNTPNHDLLPDSAPRGTGALLGFRPTDGSDFKEFEGELASGEVRFGTTRRYDRQVNGFAIKGKVGQTKEIGVMDEGGYLEGTSYLTLPEGVSLIGHQEGEAGELLFCEYTDEKNRKVVCPAPNNPLPVLRVHIDKRVDGAQGTISVKPDPEHPDPDLTNNTAPITMEYID
ncbi:hypothetical protein [Streptomyces yunnanensis]|uniref:Uncharacterized protein n=1 Tax=Streptomyces yunnanensis TaxID=156453 RepID=A0A9X8QP75_9ACTN|nr:hypothetical protein [Streptomyces yunnanensis]SHL05973.1 hypothetical protein SAMN05216268_102389 [Streptomyces yunnanensis]